MTVDEKALAAAVLAAPGTTLEDCRAIAEPIVRAYLQALRPGSTGEGEGWVLVPKEPTIEMRQAALEASRAHKQVPVLTVGYELHSSVVVYRAMLAAAGGEASHG